MVKPNFNLGKATLPNLPWKLKLWKMNRVVLEELKIVEMTVKLCEVHSLDE